MKISYTTLACPTWDLETICTQAVACGYDGIDFRGYLDEIDITKLPFFQNGEAAAIISDHGLTVSGVSSSLRICDANHRQADLEEARRTIAVCQQLGAKHVRIFGGGDFENLTREAVAQIGHETMRQILELDGAKDLSWDFETHDVWIRASDCRMLLEMIPFPQFNILWDIGNTFMSTDDSPEEIYEQIGESISYCHFKDAVKANENATRHYLDWQYVDVGSGDLPMKAAVQMLESKGYQGWYVLEHEKRWHPDLKEPESAIRSFANWIHSI